MRAFVQTLWEQFQRYRGQQAERRELLAMDQRQLRDIGLVGRDDVFAVLNGTYFSDTTRLPRRAVNAGPPTDVGRIPGTSTTDWRRCA